MPARVNRGARLAVVDPSTADRVGSEDEAIRVSEVTFAARALHS